MAIKYSATNLFKYKISDFIKTTLFPEEANTYVAIGRPIRWGADSNETTDEIEDVFISTNYVNESHRNTMAMKRIKAADIALWLSPCQCQNLLLLTSHSEGTHRQHSCYHRWAAGSSAWYAASPPQPSC